MSAGWDAAVERAAKADWDPGAWADLHGYQREAHRHDARAALTAAVGPGGLLLSAEDVADLQAVIWAAERWRFIGDDEASNEQDDAARDALDRLRARLAEAIAQGEGTR